MMLYIYYIEGDFVVWFEIYVFLLFFLKKKNIIKIVDEGCV